MVATWHATSLREEEEGDDGGGFAGGCFLLAKVERERGGVLSLPLPERCGPDFPIFQYADDTLLIMEACSRQLLALKALLNSFAESTGLRVNYQKSNIYPINVEAEKMEILATTFDCQVGSYPCPYLGLHMGPSKPKVDDFLPLIQRIEKRLLSTSTFLNQAGRIEMVNAVLSALPTFFKGNVKFPPSVYKHIDKYRKHCINIVCG
jgi:hypothetical protein